MGFGFVLVITLLLNLARSENIDLRFCVLSEAELAKCEAMAEATLADQMRDDLTFGSYFHKITCTVPYSSPEECMQDMAILYDETKPNVIVVDAGDVFIGGRYHSLVPILREVIRQEEISSYY